MSNFTQVAASRAITVPFHGADLYVVEHKGQPYTPMKPIVSAMGLDWGSQFRKVAANESRWGIVNLTIPSAGGEQAMTCLPVRKTAAWLTTIEPGKVKNPEVRARVIQYQNECDDVLWQYWNDGIAINPRAAYSVNPGDVLTKEEADTLRQMVEGMAKKLTSDTKVQGKFIMQAWSKLKAHFHVGYRQIPRQELTEAISIVNRHTVEWELVDEVNAIDLSDALTMKAMRKVAWDYLDEHAKAVREGKNFVEMKYDAPEVVQSIFAHALMEQRLYSWFNYSTGKLQSKLIPSDAMMFSPSKDDYSSLVEMLPMERIHEMLERLNKRVACHIGAFSDYLKSNRTNMKAVAA